jgi:DnaJ-class molecular chaperone
VLSDSTKRQIYDVHGKDASRTAGSGGGGASPFGARGPFAGGADEMTPEELFEFLFTGRPPQRGVCVCARVHGLWCSPCTHAGMRRSAPRSREQFGGAFPFGGASFHTFAVRACVCTVCVCVNQVSVC